MKKLLLFAILFSISTSVSASTSYYLTDSSGSSEITIGLETVELLFWYTGTPIMSFDVEVEVSGPGTITGGKITATGRNPDYDDVLLLPYGIELIASADLGGSLGTGIANPLATIDFRADNVGDVILDLHNIGTFDPTLLWIDPVCHGMIIHIPEPVTIVLLGLGGLLLRTKK